MSTKGPGVAGRGRRRLTAVLGAVILAIMVLGVLVPLLLTLTGSSRYEVNAEGVYVFRGGEWERVDLGYSPWIPADNGSYIVYFRNLNCPHCREFDPHWWEFVDKYSAKVNATAVTVVCTYFQLACSDPTAISTFNAFRVSASPMLVVISNATILYYGIPPFNATELYNFTYHIISSAGQAEETPPEERS